MVQTNRYYLSYIFKPNSEYIAVELQKVIKQLGANMFSIKAIHETIINEDWSHTQGNVWRHEVSGMWYFKHEVEEARTIIDNWLGGD